MWSRLEAMRREVGRSGKLRWQGGAAGQGGMWK